MQVDTVAQALHHRATCGETLSPEEQARLQQWYAAMDREESEMLARTRQADGLDDLQAAIDATNAKIIVEAQKIQALELENERLRRVNRSLEQQLAQKKGRQTV